MNSFFLESPYILGGILLVLVLITWYAWLQSGQRLALGIALVATIVSALLMALNLMVVTDREAISELIANAASDINENKTANIKDLIHPKASGEVNAAMQILPRIKFEEARVTRIHSVEVDDSDGAKTAQVRMNVFVKGELSNFQFNAPRWVLLDFVQDPTSIDPKTKKPKWLITHVEHRDAHHEFINH